jgi:hypothetical protein
MTDLSIFKTYLDPLEAEELIEILEKHNIPFDRTFEKLSDADDYVGSNPFDAEIVIRIAKKDFARVEALLNTSI